MMALSKPTESYIEDMLTCPICYEIVSHPLTLQKCFHSFCTECLEKLEMKQKTQASTSKQKGTNGIVCPICRNLSPRDEISANFFVKDLLEMYRKSVIIEGEIPMDGYSSDRTSKTKQCEQCFDTDNAGLALWRCTDCKFNICDSCHTSHLKIPLLKCHNIIPLDQLDTDTAVLNHLIFCDIHTNKTIELYCLPCRQPLCMKCKVTHHENHETETIENAIEFILPNLEECKQRMARNLQLLTHDIQVIDERVQKVTDAHTDCRNAIDNVANEAIVNIQRQQQALHLELDENEQSQLEVMNADRLQLSYEQKKCENLIKISDISLERARNPMLLDGVIKGGLHYRMMEQEKYVGKEADVDLKVPHYENAGIHDGINMGKITYSEEEHKLNAAMGGVMLDDLIPNTEVQVVPNEENTIHISRKWPVNLENFFTQNTFKKIHQFQVSGFCIRMAVVKHMLWLPMKSRNKVYIYSKDGKFQRDIDIKTPRSVHQVDDIAVIACCEEGLYTVNTTNQQPPKLLQRGTFSDLCTYNNTLYALNYEKISIMEFEKSQNQEEELILKSEMKLKGFSKLDITTSFISKAMGLNPFHTQPNNETGFETFITSRYGHKLCHVAPTGETAAAYDYNSSSSYICAIDSEVNLLVVDADKDRIRLFRTCDNTWIHVNLPCGMEAIHDMILDEEQNLWVLCFNSRKRSHVIHFQIEENSD